MKTLKYLIKIIIKRQGSEHYSTIIFYSSFIAFTLCLTLLCEVFTFSRNFFEQTYILIYQMLFTSVIITSSDSFNIIIKRSIQMMIACIIGDIIAYALLSLFIDHIWIAIFPFMIFMLFTCGLFLSTSEKRDYINWTIGKRMYFEIFTILYVAQPTTRSPIIFLKSGLSSIITVFIITISCLIFNPYFSSELFLRTTVKILHRSHQCNKLLVRQIESKTINQLNLQNSHKTHKSQKNIINDINSRLSNSLTYIPIYNENIQNHKKHHHNPLSLSNLDIVNHLFEDDLEDALLKSRFKSYNTSKENLEIEKMKLLLAGNSQIINEAFREKFMKNKIKYSKNLNLLAIYFKECGDEFWNHQITNHFRKLAILLERNHNIINSMQISIDKDISNPRCKLLLPLIPFINLIINQSSNIFIILENQISTNYKFSKFKKMFKRKKCQKEGDDDDDYDYSFKFGNDRIKYYFNRIKSLEIEMEKQFSKIKVTNQFIEATDQDSQCEISRIYFFLSLLLSFTKQQKEISDSIFQISNLLNKQNTIYHLEQYVLIFIWVFNLPKLIYEKIKMARRSNEDDEDGMKEEGRIEKIKNYIKFKLKHYYKNKLFTQWRFTIKFTIFFSIFIIAYYELVTKTTFILFQNSSWFVITFLYIVSPSVGSSGFYCCLRFMGTCSGITSAYVVGIFFSLAGSDFSKAVVYIVCTFALIFIFHFFTRGKQIKSFSSFFILSYATISYAEYNADKPLIITALLRAFHISMAIFACLLMSILVLPYFENKRLESNLLDLTIDQNNTFKSIFKHHCSLFTIKDIDNENDIIPSNNLFQSTITPYFRILRSKISQQRTLLFNSRFELLFNKSRYKDLKSILNNLSSQYMVLVGSEYIFQDEFIFKSLSEINSNTPSFYFKHHNHHHHHQDDNNKFSNDVKSIILPKFYFIINELDKCMESIKILKKFKKNHQHYRLHKSDINNVIDNDTIITLENHFNTNISKQIIKEIYDDYHLLILKYSNAIYTLHQLGCLIYTFDLFINLHCNIFQYICSLNNIIKIERVYNNNNNNNNNNNDNVVANTNSSNNSGDSSNFKDYDDSSSSSTSYYDDDSISSNDSGIDLKIPFNK